jgi:tRNA pseudouridine13 synthase
MVSESHPLPLITGDLPRISGRIKSEPSHFSVTEIPLYDAVGEGEHIYVTFTREGWNTRDLVKELSHLFGVRSIDVGYAGLKDRNALARQTLSIHHPSLSVEEAARIVVEIPRVSGVTARRHTNKLRLGHLKGNRFRIVVSDPLPDALERAMAIRERILNDGIPNYYGEQRFGRYGDNAERGREILAGRQRAKGWLRTFLLSAYQSELFNRWLALRISEGLFLTLLEGDIAQKYDSGGLFVVEEPDAEMERFRRGEISHTGPMYGKKMKRAQGRPLELENRILIEDGISEEVFARAGLDGTRRTGRILLSEIAITQRDSGILFDFALPPGSFATVVLREFTGADGFAEEESGDMSDGGVPVGEESDVGGDL